MKATILIYCGPDGNAGRGLAVTLRKNGDRVMLRDAATFNQDVEHCNKIVIMPDVGQWSKDRLVASYGADFKTEIVLHGKTVFGRDAAETETLIAKHRGRGRWFVMRGDEIVSGPHTKDEAQRLAA